MNCSVADRNDIAEGGLHWGAEHFTLYQLVYKLLEVALPCLVSTGNHVPEVPKPLRRTRYRRRVAYWHLYQTLQALLGNCELGHSATFRSVEPKHNVFFWYTSLHQFLRHSGFRPVFLDRHFALLRTSMQHGGAHAPRAIPAAIN